MQTIGKDERGLYWLSFSGKTGYIGIVHSSDRDFKQRWKEHDQGEKWPLGTVKNKYPGNWSYKIKSGKNNSSGKPSIHVWRYKVPRFRNYTVSCTDSTRKAILEGLETVLIYNLAKKRRDDKNAITTYKRKTVLSGNNTMINDTKYAGTTVSDHLKTFCCLLGTRKLIITGGPTDKSDFHGKYIHSLAKELFTKNNVKLNPGKYKPPKPAKEYKEGTKKVGPDGTLYFVKGKRWQRKK